MTDIRTIEKEKLLLITDGFPYGESEHSFLYTEFQELCKYFEITVLAINPKEKNIKYPIPKAAQAESIKIPQISLKGIGTFFSKSFWKELKDAKKKCSLYIFLKRTKRIVSYWIGAVQILYKIERSHKNIFDFIYTYWCTPATLAAVWYKDKHPETIVLTRFHRYDLFLEQESFYWQCFRDEIAMKSDKLCFISQQGLDYFCRHWTVDSEKCMVSYLGTKDMGYQESTSSGNLVMVSNSNIIHRKRIDLIIQALAQLDDKIMVSWYHIGEGTARQPLEAMCANLLNGKPNIKWRFWGWVDNDEIADLYRDLQVQLFISTSSSEGLAVSLQESLSMGIPVIATNVGGTKEILRHQANGILLPTEPSVNEISKAISRFYYLSTEKRLDMGREARDIWEKYLDAKNNADNFVQMVMGLKNN